MNTAEEWNSLPPTLLESRIDGLEKIQQGKVRDIYRVDTEHLLIVTTDRMSAFDVVLPDPIPGKGWVLTQIANFWFERSEMAIPNHLTDVDIADVLEDPAKQREMLDDRSLFPENVPSSPRPIGSSS